MRRLGRKRLAVDIPIALHEELKRIAINRNCTITTVVLRFLVEKALQESKLAGAETKDVERTKALSNLLPF